MSYKGNRLSSFLCPDFVCLDDVIVEVKALTESTGREESQVLGYLKGTGFLTGLFLNFGVPSLWHKRYAHSSKWLPQPAGKVDKVVSADLSSLNQRHLRTKVFRLSQSSKSADP